MKPGIVVTLIVIALIATAMAVQGYSPPLRSDFVPADRLPGPSYDRVKPLQGPGHASPLGGFSSVDFLGQIRKQLDFGRICSMFPFAWPGGRSAGDVDRAEYLGFEYNRAAASPLPQGLYYTGEQYGGKRIYAPAPGNNSPGVPGIIYLRDGDDYRAYASAGLPPVYACVLYGSYNIRETVGFGLANSGGGRINLSNAAPYEIQIKEGGSWRTIFTPVAAQVITSPGNGETLEWQWDQRLDNGTPATFGDYRALIQGRYAAPFRIAPDVPAVVKVNNSYSVEDVDNMAVSCPPVGSFKNASYASGGSDDMVSLLQFKARALGLDDGCLRAAIATGNDGTLVPCLAIKAKFEGQPAWIVFYCGGTAGESQRYVEARVTGDPGGSLLYSSKGG